MAGRALVCGGGGVTGVAWMAGILSGLREAGVDLTRADLVVGTSAGSVVGARLACGVDLDSSYQDELRGTASESTARLGYGALLRHALAMVRTRDPRRYRAIIGRMARSASTMPEAERRAVIAARLGVSEWPAGRRLLVTAVDTDSGDVAAWDRDSGVPLIDAVAASCAVPGVWPPVTVQGRRWMDGGVRSMTNADLAGGHKRVVVLAPLLLAAGHVTGVGAQVRQLRRDGAQVLVVSPDRAARQAIGRNVLDPARRGPAARAGRLQAVTVADLVRPLWT
ncbi:patatin-like phospholipase family protein [Micromonospora echinofusca]|uniref:Patatin-like phospholipase family protein n=1 Tax=Micromonospora echinofusca TaxID=47858 RepID=A0ABS3W1E4_MICEH|nr:patatin-like phospholipase family protein [Micromonospora echinofusca]MBO4210616.1 patatin-like phospholipase family protein [Micromonospora echinofusca]